MIHEYFRSLRVIGIVAIERVSPRDWVLGRVNRPYALSN